MAYNRDEVRTEIASFPVGMRGDSIKVAEIKSKTGNISVDIRRWYIGTDASGEEVELPTQKGIRLNDEILVDVVACMINNMGAESLIDLVEGLDDDVRDSIVACAEKTDEQ